MKGVVFTELLEMAETQLSEWVVDEIIESVALENGGAYTRVGNYPCSELIALVEAIGARMNVSPRDLQQSFGHWMFKSFSASNPEFLVNRTNAFEMLEAIENEVHVEVRKLYPDAELPRFETIRPDENSLTMRYMSQRPLKYFCLGLIEGCLAHFNEVASIRIQHGDAEDLEVAEFFIKRAA